MSVFYLCDMNNRHETPYRLLRDGFDEIQVGWERVYELTPRGLMDKVYELSFTYDKAISVSFPEWWKSDKEANLPALILNNIFGIVPYYDYKGDFIFIRVVNLATNEAMQQPFPGIEDDLLYICKRILTYCKLVLRSWGKEQYREFRYGMQYLRDDYSNWHKMNYPDAFLRQDVRIYDILKYKRPSLNACVNHAYKGLTALAKEDVSFKENVEDVVYELSKATILDRLESIFFNRKPSDLVIMRDDLQKMFWFLLDRDLIVRAFQELRQKTHYNYNERTYALFIAEAILPY